MTYTVKESQTGYDLALQLVGDISKVFTLLKDNNLGFDDLIPQGSIVSYTESTDQKRFLMEVAKRGIVFTSEEEIIESLTGYMATEGGDYLTTEDDDYLIL